MTCAACAARVEGRLNAIENVSATVNIATEKATVTAPLPVPVRRLVEEIERLIVALVFFVPLSDLSVLLSLLPAYRFPGWQWVLVMLAVPVAGWAAWPFHRAALKNARHGSTSMDTLVSLGIVAACGWSVYAMFVLDSGTVHHSAWYELIHASGGGIYLEVAASVTTFLLAGRWHEARARRSAAARSELGSLPHADGFTALPGLGARGVVDGHGVIVGREKIFRDGGLDIPAELAAQCLAWEQAGRTVVLAGWDGRARGAVAVADTVKPSAASSVFVVGNSVRLRRFGTLAAGLGPRRRPATFGRGEPSGDGTGTEPGDETGTKEHAASCPE